MKKNKLEKITSIFVLASSLVLVDCHSESSKYKQKSPAIIDNDQKHGCSGLPQSTCLPRLNCRYLRSSKDFALGACVSKKATENFCTQLNKEKCDLIGYLPKQCQLQADGSCTDLNPEPFFGHLPVARFIAFGDFGTRDKNQRAVAEAMVKECQRKKCDFGLTLGDNVYEHGVSNNLAGQPDYKLITDTFVPYRPLQMPIYMVFGNHDVDQIDGFSQWKSWFWRENKDILMKNQLKYTLHPDNLVVKDSSGKDSRLWNFSEPFYTKNEKGNIHLFAIDTNSFPHRALNKYGKIVTDPENNEQIEWLKNALAKVPEDKWKLVFGHFPLRSYGEHGPDNEIKEFKESIIDLLCTEKVDFYFSGHDHYLGVDQYQCSNGHLIALVTSGAAAKSNRIRLSLLPKDNKTLLWVNGKDYDGGKSPLEKFDAHGGFSKVLGYAVVEVLDDKNVMIAMKLVRGPVGGSDGYFKVTKHKGISLFKANNF